MPEFQSTMTPEMREGLQRYLAAGEKRRQDETTAMIDNLTEREQALVREAAVMGFVQGAMAEAGGVRAKALTRESEGGTYPGDTNVMRLVVSHCHSMPDLYPTIASLDGIDRTEDEDEED